MRHTQYRARFIECGTSASVSLDGKWRIFLSKNANPMVLHLSGMLCQSPRHARAHQGHDIFATVVLEVAGCESLRGITLFIFSYLNMLVWMCSCLHAPTLFCPCGIYQSGTNTSLSSDDMLRIYLGMTRIQLPFACLVCVSVTTTRPSHRGHDIIASIDITASTVAAEAPTCD